MLLSERLSESQWVALMRVGWKTSFSQAYLDYDSDVKFVPARVVAVHRSGLDVYPQVGGFGSISLGGRWYQLSPSDRPTVGDWVVVDQTTGSVEALLERSSVIQRISPSSGELQLIAANIDTAFLVTSCNADFSPGRLERFMAVVSEAGIQPVVVLTKIDQTNDLDDFFEQVHRLSSGLPVEAVDARNPETLSGVRNWCLEGQTIALLGSSGVGKSTLVNSLAGRDLQATAAIRESDAKGRHTTTHRSLHFLPGGSVILDSPGMREFQIAEASEGVQHVFDEIEALAQLCRFGDCRHENEPGCAVQEAIGNATLDPRRLDNFFKLQREEQYNSESVAQRHARVRSFSKRVKAANKVKSKRGDGN